MGWITGHGDGTFAALNAEERGAIWCHFLHVREAVGDPYNEVLPIVDVVAWEDCRPWAWWMLRRGVAILGEWEIAWAWRDRRPARMLATPADFLRCHGAGFCIVDWNKAGDFLDMLDDIEVTYSDPWLSNKLVQARIGRDFPHSGPLPKPEIFSDAA
jgi:hypothetical protein